MKWHRAQLETDAGNDEYEPHHQDRMIDYA